MDDEHPRFVVRFDRALDGWEVYDELARFAVFGCDRKRVCDEYARERNHKPRSGGSSQLSSCINKQLHGVPR
jgi:hypothetical protein